MDYIFHHFCLDRENDRRLGGGGGGCYCRRRNIISTSRLIFSIIVTILVLLVGSDIIHYTKFYVTAFSSSSKSRIASSSQCSYVVNNIPSTKPIIFSILRNERYTKSPTLKRTTITTCSPHTTSLFTSNPLYPQQLLDVALDQPLYTTPIRRYFLENTYTFLLSRINAMLKGLIGLFSVFNDVVLFNTMTIQRFIKYSFLLFTIVICSKYIIRQISNIDPKVATTADKSFNNSINPKSSSISSSVVTSKEDIVPMPFDSSINEGWSICKLHSIVPYGTGETGTTNKKQQPPTLSSSSLVPPPYKHIKMELPQSNYILPLQLGQPIHICGLDRNGNAIQAEFYPFQKQTPGYFSILVPTNSIQYSSINEIATATTVESDDENHNSNNNDLQQIRVIQLLQDYMKTGDTEIAIHPGITTKLQYRGTYYPVTEIIYIAIGPTGIVPVLDQIRTVLKNTSSKQQQEQPSNSGVQRISVVWITSTIDEFDTLSPILKQIYDQYSTQLAVSCGVETTLQNSMNQELAAEYFVENNIEMNDTIPTFQPGMMTIVSIEGIPYTSTSLLRQVTTKYLERRKGFPNDCICVL